MKKQSDAENENVRELADEELENAAAGKQNPLLMTAFVTTSLFPTLTGLGTTSPAPTTPSDIKFGCSRTCKNPSCEKYNQTVTAYTLNCEYCGQPY